MRCEMMEIAGGIVMAFIILFIVIPFLMVFIELAFTAINAILKELYGAFIEPFVDLAIKIHCIVSRNKLRR